MTITTGRSDGWMYFGAIALSNASNEQVQSWRDRIANVTSYRSPNEWINGASVEALKILDDELRVRGRVGRR